MKSDTVIETIEVAALKIGMHIHLDGGWMSHPFPKSSFKISSLDQIATLRSLGLGCVRWSPQDSDVTPTTGRWDTASRPLPRAADGGAQPVANDVVEAASAALPAVDGSPVTASRSEVVSPAAIHRAALSAQREALAACERQFSEAARASKVVFDSVANQPAAARQGAQALTQHLIEQMIGAEGLCIRLLSEAAGDKVTAHAVNVSVISLIMGRNFGLAEDEMLDLGIGALLHDVGKVDLPERLRHREDHYSAAEQKLYENHVAHGIAQARRMELSAGAANVIAQHHELIDGSGFPLKLLIDRTAVMSRIVAIVNRYDNLCNPANPGKAITPHEAVALMFAQGRSKYDPAILGAFIKMMGVYPAGSVVQLTDERYALVVGSNFSRPLKPRVLVHEPGVPRDEALILNLESAPGLGIRRSLKPVALPERTLNYLSPRPRVSYFFEPTHEMEAVA
ncbi:MAG: DUF3391 domain-containing protein [Burkholderiaceae bacterium]|nr:DUF3391 domain-containing protein [Burkholderiaceae bacterium]